MNNNFGSKIRELREAKRLSMLDLGQSVGVSKQSIHRYETNQKVPRTSTLISISNVLGKHPSFFFEDDSFEIEIGDISFREERTIQIGTLDIDGVKSECKLYLQRLFELQELLGEDVSFENPLEDFEISNKRDVEKAAKNLRRKWNIGFNAIPDVTDLIESKNISVIELNLVGDFTGLMGFANDEIPFIVVNENLNDISRKRFTLLHELAHIVLKFSNQLAKDKKEKLCDHFAGAILLVDDTLTMELGKNRTTISIQELKAIKEKYGISIKAIIIRASVTGLISYDTSGNWWNSYKEWQSGNKDHDGFGIFPSKEKPLKFDKLLFRGINEKKISWEKAATLKDSYVDVLRKQLNQLELKMV